MPLARMNPVRLAPMAIVLVAVALFASAPVARAQTTASKIAIANPVTIFGQLKQTKDLIADMNNKNKTLESARISKQSELTDLHQRRDTLKPDTDQWRTLNDQLLQKTIEYQNWLQFNTASIQQQQKMQIKTLYDKIVAAVGKVAVQRGIDLVIAEQRPDFDFEQVNIDQLRAALAQRNILFNAEAVDISNQVIAAMDAEYSAAGK